MTTTTTTTTTTTETATAGLAWTAGVTDPVLRALIPRILREMGPGELTRLCRLQPPARRRQFLAGHVLARVAVAHWLRERGQPASGWVIDQLTDGRPTLSVLRPDVSHAGLPARAGLSIAHSEGHVAVLVSAAACGVDVEAATLPAEVSRLVLTTSERRLLSPLDQAAEARRRWVVQEALAKATDTPVPQVLRSVARSGDLASSLPRGGDWGLATWQRDGADYGVVLQAAASSELTVCRGVAGDLRPMEIDRLRLHPVRTRDTYTVRDPNRDGDQLSHVG